MTQGRFATSGGGRVGPPRLITEPGVDKTVACDDCDLGPIRGKVEISINAHKSEVVVVSGHHDCAGNPVPAEKHISQIKKGVETISSWGLGVEVIGAWVDETWSVSRVR